MHRTRPRPILLMWRMMWTGFARLSSVAPCLLVRSPRWHLYDIEGGNVSLLFNFFFLHPLSNLVVSSPLHHMVKQTRSRWSPARLVEWIVPCHGGEYPPNGFTIFDPIYFVIRKFSEKRGLVWFGGSPPIYYAWISVIIEVVRNQRWLGFPLFM